MITLTTEQAQQIEEALKLAIRTSYSEHNNIKFEASLATIRAARAQEQAEQEQEPVSVLKASKANFERQFGKQVFADWIYDDLTYSFENASPVRTKDLTDDELRQVLDRSCGDGLMAIARAVIAADREKNRG